MNIWQRASLYLTRNKKKTVILLAILTVITTLVLICISVGNGAATAMDNLRKTMGGYFKIDKNREQGYYGNMDDAIVQDVMGLGGIKAYNGQDVRYLLAEELELEPGRFTSEGDRKAKLARVLGNTDSSLNEYFVLEYFVLSEGRHITPEDEGKALISQELADRNGLSVGDTFSMILDTEDFSDDQEIEVTAHPLEVAGIYQIENRQGTSSLGGDPAECDMEENFIFTDTAYIRGIYEELIGEEIHSYNSEIAFFVENPKELDGIVASLSSLSQYNWDEYVITKNNKTYEDSAGPLERLSGLVTVMVLVIVVISAVMLSLILFLWMRERVHEIGIYLSVGIKKMEIFRQQILENLAVAILAFFLAWGIAAAASGVTGQVVENQFTQETEEQETEAEAAAQKTEEGSMVEIRIGLAELAQIAGIGVLIILVSTGISSITVLRMQPRDIFSKMS